MELANGGQGLNRKSATGKTYQVMDVPNREESLENLIKRIARVKIKFYTLF